MKYQSYIALAIPATLLLLLLGTLVALPRMQRSASVSATPTRAAAPIVTLAPVVVRPPAHDRRAAAVEETMPLSRSANWPERKATDVQWLVGGSSSDLSMPYYSFGAAVLTRAGD